MPTRMMPPAISAVFGRMPGMRLAAMAPPKAMRNVVQPITAHESTTPGSGGENAKLTPTAERVDARCHGEREQPLVGERRHAAGALLAAAHGLKDHFAADEREQRKAHVRADGRDIAGHRAAENVTRERHEKLERAEIQPVPERIARLERAHGDAVCNGHRKRIHGKGNADEYDRKHGSLRTGKEYGRRARTRA